MGLMEDRTVYVNVQDEPFGVHSGEVLAEKWDVVNAPRPLSGCATWTGPFRHGHYYAAGPRELFGQSWDDDDARPVALITNEEILDRLRRHCEENWLSLDHLTSALDRYGIKVLAGHYRLPWRGPDGGSELLPTKGDGHGDDPQD